MFSNNAIIQSPNENSKQTKKRKVRFGVSIRINAEMTQEVRV